MTNYKELEEISCVFVMKMILKGTKKGHNEKFVVTPVGA
jgi:hypothetical protein